MNDSYRYKGEELEVFSRAINWRVYWQSQLSKYIGKNILEVGAGIGSTSAHFKDQKFESWLALEPDSEMASHMEAKFIQNYPKCFKVHCGSIYSLNINHKFDTILYIDVLEHIKDDKEELEAAFLLLKEGGNLIILSPAHQFLYSSFDFNVGHYRRYSKRQLSKISPQKSILKKCVYLDSVGLLASLANKILLKTKVPTPFQIDIWDKLMVQSSKKVDLWLKYSIGKTIICIWQKPF
jgi:2-polyprenyl-3-methyl-5-hydroxy-6-metoxy-1,4-benzoquinol methylase